MGKKETGIDKSLPQDGSPPPSAFDEPSTPSQVKPEDKPKDTLVGRQEENPQAVMKRKSNTKEEETSEKEEGNRGGPSKSKL